MTTPTLTTSALIIVDLQNDYFTGGKFQLAGTEAAAANAARLLDAARKAGDLVVHVRHISNEPDAGFFVKDTPGAEINAAVRNRDGESVVTKHRINAFLDTDLKQILERNRITEVAIAGAMSHMCVDAATRAAADLGYSVTVIHDAVATRDLSFNGVTVPAAQVHAAFMAALEFGYGAVLSADAYLAGRKTAASSAA